jgi:hypothetical protein
MEAKRGRTIDLEELFSGQSGSYFFNVRKAIEKCLTREHSGGSPEQPATHSLVACAGERGDKTGWSDERYTAYFHHKELFLRLTTTDPVDLQHFFGRIVHRLDLANEGEIWLEIKRFAARKKTRYIHILRGSGRNDQLELQIFLW